MTDNPFESVMTTSGIFAATASQSDMAARICAGVCQAIQSDAKRILDFSWWTECAGNIPALVDGGISAEDLKPGDPALQELASKLSSVPGLSKKIFDAASALPGLCNLNCFVIEASPAGMNIVLSKLSADITQPGARLGTVKKRRYFLNSGNSRIANELHDIFGDIPPLSNEPYYVAV
nr:hypothetical protein [uncultured Rhodopila sp.]